MTSEGSFSKIMQRHLFSVKSLLAIALLIGLSVFYSMSLSASKSDDQSLLIVIVLSVIAFFVLTMTSAARQFKSKMLQGVRAKEACETNNLKNTRHNFRESVEEFLELVDQTNKQFEGKFESSDIDILKENVLRLINANAKLNANYLQEGIGNDNQKDKMKAILDRQSESVSNALESLKTFTGNLALIDVTGQKEAIDQEISFINQGLKEAIEEEGFNV